MAMTDRITKAVIPAAGLGTRFLPATKAMPKEMLPVVDKPAIQYVVEEAVDAGLTDVLMITGRNKNALENHFDRVAELEYTLEAKGDTAKLEQVNESTDLAQMHYVRQGDPKGLGHAIQRAEMHVGDEPFAVLEVDPDSIHLYGAAAVEPTDDPDVVRITGRAEKPAKEVAPSNYAVIGRYVLKPEVFAVLDRTEPGKGGEIQLTDALMEMANDVEGTGGVFGVVFRGRRYDTGDKVDYIKAVIQLAAERDDLGPELRPWLAEYAAGLERG